MDTISGRDFAAKITKSDENIFYTPSFPLSRFPSISKRFFLFFTLYSNDMCFSQTILPFPNFLHVLSSIYKIPLGNEKREGEGGEKKIQTIFLIADAKLYKHECTQESS